MIRDQRIRDPVHNLIKFSKENPDDEVLWRLVQTPALQRLRRIKQLGFSEFVYPGASHTRLSHVIGAMQMARRMLGALERNQAIPLPAKDQKKWRTATLCAALLHDVGHGPFSHVFEEVSEDLGVEIAHEEYTRRIIAETEVAKVLKDYGVFKETLSFFEQEPGFNAYSSIISSQLDADRLDFLVRDRYFTGIRSSAIDLEWLFDSLRIQNILVDVKSGAKQYMFAVDKKGLSTVEEYISAYTKMYSNIYFHKTTRGVQFMVADILKRVFTDAKLLRKIPNNDPLKRYFSERPSPSLESYLRLDDACVVNIIRFVSDGDFGSVSVLAKRYLNRDLYKCFSPPKKPKGAPNRNKLENFIKALKKKDVFHHRDIPPSKRYKQYDVMGDEFVKNILIISDEKEPLPIADFTAGLEGQYDRDVRFYFETDLARSKAIKLWESA